MPGISEMEELAIRVRRAIVKATQEGTTGYPYCEVDGFQLRLLQCADSGPAWCYPPLCGRSLTDLLDSGRRKQAAKVT